MKVTLDYSLLRCECGLVLYRHPDRERVTCMGKECEHYDKIFRLPPAPTIEAAELIGERDGWRAPGPTRYAPKENMAMREHDTPGPEEGGEDVFGVPDYCVRWPCEGKVKLDPLSGLMICTDCGASYGEAETHETGGDSDDE